MIPSDISKKQPDGFAEADTDSNPNPRSSDLGPFVSLMSEIEWELRRQGQWELAPPKPEAFESRLPFCCESMRFTQWVQWVFIPRTRALVEAGGPMPEVSGIRPMAEEALRDCAWNTIRLMVLLDRFDRMIDERSASISRE